MIKDYLIPYRIIIKLLKKHEIRQEVDDFLPKPYDPKFILAACRLNDGENKGEFSKETQNDLHNKRFVFEDLSGGYVNYYEANNIKFAGIEAGALYGIDLFKDYLEVDKYVYEGMERLTNLHFNSISDLSSKVAEYKHTFWDGLSDKGIDKLGGHIGEVYAAEHLQQAGSNIQWPDVSNQAGWDLLVNGHEVNVKLVSDFNSLSQHFAEYSNIPVVIPGDAANIPADAIHFDPTHGIDQVIQALSQGNDHLVFVDDALSNHDIMQHTHNATDVLLGNHSIIDFHVPVATLVFSGWRETNLLLKNKTDVESAVKNIGLDAAGTGIGGFAGAKTGGVIGAAVGGPIGAGIGALIGGIGGAIFGRKITNEVKRGALDEALSDYNSAETKLTAKITYESNKFNTEFKRAKNIEQEFINQQMVTEKNRLKESIESLKQYRENQDKLTITFANELLDSSIKEIEMYIDQANTNIIKSGFIRGLFLPTNQDILHDELMKKIGKYKSKLISFKRKINKTNEVKRTDIFSVISKFGLQHDEIQKLIIDSEDVRKERERDIRDKIEYSQAKLLKCRVNSLINLRNTAENLRERMRKNVKPYIDKMNKLSDRVRTEAGKLGLDM